MNTALNNFNLLLGTTKIGIFFIGLAVLLFILMLFMLCFYIGKKAGNAEAQKEQLKLIEEARADAVRRSRSVLNGQLVEQISPFLPDFPCNPADCRFIGKPLDFIAFAGLEETDSVDEILFIEVKTNSSQLSQRERSLKEAVEKKKIRWVEFRVKN
ncbi:MAG: hypothetical protein J6U06_09090 [Spirochaetaceae bacterium]|nr:hypothetical protein [Spirochaetaceae bacterium]